MSDPSINWLGRNLDEAAQRRQREAQLIEEACAANNALTRAVGVLARSLRVRNLAMEDFAQQREQEHRSVNEMNEALCERVSEFCFRSYTMGEDLMSARKSTRRYQYLIIFGAVVFVIIRIVLPLFKAKVDG